MTQDSRDLTRVVLGVLTILGLILSSFWILRPFLLAIIWAGTIVVATWPLMLTVEGRLGKRRWAAVTVMVGVMLLAFILPVTFAIGSIASNADNISDRLAALPEKEVPPLPESVRALPLVGRPIGDAWDRLAASGMQSVVAQVSASSRQAAAWVLQRLKGVGGAFLQFALTVIVAAVMYANGETAARGLLRFGRRLGGDQGEQAIRLAGQCVKSVALGVIVTALIQTTLAGVGLWVAGVPFTKLLSGVILVLCIAQLGPLPVLIPAVIWVFSARGAGWGTVFLIYSLLVGLLDNVLRPLLIKRGADLPLLVIFSGVIGGLIGFGVIGLFVGPVVLGVTYTLLRDWIERAPA